MPVSPFQRAVEGNLNSSSRGVPDTAQEGSSESKGKKKRKSKPTSKKRNRKQSVKKRYAEAREDAQLAGVIPTTPEGAVHEERVFSVDPVDGLPKAVRDALRAAWEVPGPAKATIVARLLYPFFNDTEMIDADGKLIAIPTPPKMLNELARTLLNMDQTQYERDNPEAAGKAKGGGPSVAVGITVRENQEAAALIRGMIERGELGMLEEVRVSDKSGPPGSRGQQREMEAGPTSSSD